MAHSSSRSELEYLPEDWDGLRKRAGTDYETSFELRASLRMSCVRLKIAAWPLRRARITSIPRLVGERARITPDGGLQRPTRGLESCGSSRCCAGVRASTAMEYSRPNRVYYS